MKNYKIVFATENRSDTLMSNGELFVPYNIHYFKSKIDIIKAFMQEN